MFQSLLKNLAKKYLVLVEKEESKALALARRTEELIVLKDKVADLAATNKHLMLLCGEMKNRYPEVWLDGDVAAGLFRLPKLQMAVEFYREENKLCVVIPFEKAAGKNPLEFIPDFLEKDPDLEIEGQRDKMNGTVFIYKIPILGWNDALEMTKNIKDEQPNYELDGSIREKTKTFRAKCGINGTMRRSRVNRKTYMTLWFMESDMPRADRYPVGMLVPKGNFEPILETVKFNTLGESPNKIWCWEFQVKEVAAQKLEPEHEIKVLQAGTAASEPMG